MENSNRVWKTFTNPLWNLQKKGPKNPVTVLGFFHYNSVKTVRQQLSRMVLSDFLPSLSLSNIELIFHSFQLHVTPQLEPLHHWSQSAQLLCLGSSCCLPNLFLVQEVVWVKAVFSTTVFFANFPKVPRSSLLVIICTSFPLLYTDLAPLVGHSLALRFIWTRSQASPLIFLQL